MNTKDIIKRAVIIMLSIIMLTNCACYNKVKSHPEQINTLHPIMLHKDQLKFRLQNTYVSADTLYGKIAENQTEPSKTNQMIVFLKPNQEVVQDSLGVLVIPFSQIEYVEFYEKDLVKSKRSTIAAVCVSVGLGIIIFITLASMATKDALEDMTFKI